MATGLSYKKLPDLSLQQLPADLQRLPELKKEGDNNLSSRPARLDLQRKSSHNRNRKTYDVSQIYPHSSNGNYNCGPFRPISSLFKKNQAFQLPRDNATSLLKIVEPSTLRPRPSAAESAMSKARSEASNSADMWKPGQTMMHLSKYSPDHCDDLTSQTTDFYQRPSRIIRPKSGYIPRRKALDHLSRADAVMALRHSGSLDRVTSDRRVQIAPWSEPLADHDLSDSETQRNGDQNGDSNRTGKRACFKPEVDVFYFKPTDRLATIENTTTAPVAGILRRKRRATTSDLNPTGHHHQGNGGRLGNNNNRSSNKTNNCNDGGDSCATNGEVTWRTELTRVTFAADQQRPSAPPRSDVIRIKMTVDCRYVREKTAVQALSGGRALVVKIHVVAGSSDDSGVSVLRQHVKKLPLPVPIDPYKVKAHVHKDGLLAIDAPVLQTSSNTNLQNGDKS